mgnify:CR=1 FL=1
MSGVFSSDNFNFYRIAFEKYHYTDNRKGSPMNYIAYMLKGWNTSRGANRELGYALGKDKVITYE